MKEKRPARKQQSEIPVEVPLRDEKTGGSGHGEQSENRKTFLHRQLGARKCGSLVIQRRQSASSAPGGGVAVLSDISGKVAACGTYVAALQ
jgi:hypothetical protein